MHHVSGKPAFRFWSIVVIITFVLAGPAQSLTSIGALVLLMAQPTGAAQAKVGPQGGKPQPNDASAPTRARLESFDASSYDGGTLIEWRTGFEIDNLGFRLYREQDGKRALLTSQILAGSALLTGQRTPLTAGKPYAWWDKANLESPANQAARYWLEEMDLEGNSLWHGPFAAQVVGGPPPEKARALELAGMGQAATSSRPVEARARLSRPSAIKASSTFWLASLPAVKISVNHEGWYRVTQAELLAAGLDPQTDPRKLQLYVDGQPQAISVIGENDGHLDFADAIEFYGVGTDALSTDTRVYWLAAGAQAGLRIQSVPAAASPASGGSFPFQVERRDRTIYFSSLLNGDSENFFGAVIASAPLDQLLTAPHLDAAATGATLEVALQGVTASLHSVNIKVNGSNLGNQSFSGRANSVASYALPPSLLHEGQNTVTLAGQNGSSDINLVDYLRVTYNHTYTADNDQLKLTAAAGQPLTIAGFSNNVIRVFDITNSAAVQEIVGQVQPQGGGFSVSLMPAGGGPRSLLAVTNNQASQARRVAANLPSNLGKSGQGADLVIVTLRDLFSAVEPLRAARQNQRLSVTVVDIEDVYDEFSFGQKTPEALKNYLSSTQTNWKKKPRYVLFVGDASYDPKNYMGAGDFDLVPTRLMDDAFMEASSDDWFVDFNNDGMAELAVGRLPARTIVETDRMIAKILSYEKSTAPDEMLLVADLNDGYDFEAASNQLLPLVSNDVRVINVDRGALGDAATHAGVLAAIRRGQRLVNYTGHGSVDLWRGNILTNTDTEGMENADHLPVFLMMTCLNGYFDDPVLDCLAEALLKAPHGGAVAVWASGGQTLPQGQWQMNQELYRQIFSASQMRLGDAVRAAKQGSADVDVRRTWILFGDPTMRLK
jgi:Peptidase family C25